VALGPDPQVHPQALRAARIAEIRELPKAPRETRTAPAATDWAHAHQACQPLPGGAQMGITEVTASTLRTLKIHRSFRIRVAFGTAGRGRAAVNSLVELFACGRRRSLQ
jgi:hypothetical protein